MSPNDNHRSSTALCASSALLLLACGGSSGAAQAGDGGGGVGGSGGAGGEAPMYDGSVAGRVVDEADQPIEGLGVSLCFEICRISETDAAGVFRFEGVEPAVQVIENIGLPGDDPTAAALVYSKFFDFVSLGVDEQLTIQRAFVVPTVTTQGPLAGPQQMTLAGGLEVGFDADVFGTEDNPLPTPAMALHFGASEIPQENWPVNGHDGFTILRAWGLAVWDLHQENEFVVTAPLGAAGPLPTGSDVAFLVADYTYGFLNGIFFEEEAELTSDGMAIRTPVGKGIDRSTLWLAVVRDGP